MSAKISNKRWAITTLFISLALALISTTGCAPRYAVVDGSETVPIKKSVLDDLYRDNTDLLKALTKCQGAK